MLTTFGDLAQTFQSQRQSTSLKSSAARLSTELTTGRIADPGKRLSGDFGPLAEISRTLKTLETYKITNAEAARFTGTLQSVLDQLRSLGGDVGQTLLQAGSSGASTFVDVGGAASRDALDAALSALNIRDAGRSVFAGIATSTPAVASADTIIAALLPMAAIETTAQGVIQAVDAFFAAPIGGFDDLGYLGAEQPLDPLNVAPDATVSINVTANSPAIRDMLKGLVTGALLAEGVLSGNQAQQGALAQTAGERVSSASGGIVTLQGRIGIVEARIDVAGTRNAAERAVLETRRAGIVGADSYETATALQQTQSQLETLFTITARLSTLKLSDFL